jgi:hypothetical protein
MNKKWLRGLPHGLPDDFDYDVIRTRSDVFDLIATLPNADRGEAAREIWQRRDRLGDRLAYAALIDAWDHDDRVLTEAFSSVDDLATALHGVAPRYKRKRPLPVWRGIIVQHNTHPRDAAVGMSWTRNRHIACWFATRRYNPSLRPFVFALNAMPEEIIALHDGRGEQEVLLEPAALVWLTDAIFAEGSTTSYDELEPDSRPTDGQLAQWQAAGARYEATARTPNP